MCFKWMLLCPSTLKTCISVVLSRRNRNKGWPLNLFVLAKYNRGFWLVLLRQIAFVVIPLSIFACPSEENVDTSFSLRIRFSTCPCRILACQWSAIDPIKRVVSSSVKSKPRTKSLVCLLVPYQVTREVVFVLWSDYNEVSSQTQASRSGVAPFAGRSADVVTRISMENPVLRTF